MMNLLNDLWALFFPRCCLVCGKRLVKEEKFLCFHCLSALPRTRMHLLPNNEVEKGLWGKLPIERASSYLFYAKGGDVRKLLFEMKYYGNAELGRFLGRCMAADLLSSGFFQGVDGLLPVPLHPDKRKKRGYNQSEMLAEGISAITGIPICRDWLVRIRYSDTQTRKGNYERWMNVKDVFECKAGDVCDGKHILLIDDVLTTGATIVACADALSRLPHLRLSVLTLALAGES